MLGTVTALRRYPVKSMLGEDLDRRRQPGRAGRGPAAGRGQPPDRQGRERQVPPAVAGPAHPVRRSPVRRSPVREAPAAGPAAGNRDTAGHEAAALITLPDGKTVSSTDADVDDVLSGLLNEPVTLTATPPPGASLDRAVPEAVLRDGIAAPVPARLIEIGAGAPPGTFVDFAPLHLLTSATLDRIAELSPYRRAHLERYRPNVVIGTGADGFTENDWLGRDLRVGDELVLRVIARTRGARCRPWPTATCPGTPRPCGSWPGTTGSARCRTAIPSRAPGSTPRCCAPAGSASATPFARSPASGRRLGLQSASRGPADRPRAAH